MGGVEREEREVGEGAGEDGGLVTKYCVIRCNSVRRARTPPGGHET